MYSLMVSLDAVLSLDAESPTIRDSLQILQLLKDDLVLWSKEIE